MSSHKICSECNQKYNEWRGWCKPCKSKHFQNDFNKWTSGNDKIDKLIQNAQLNANYNYEIIEWIPYDQFKDVKQIGKGGFGTIHHARWSDGYIIEWDIENDQWKRYREDEEVALKKFDNFVNFDNVLNEMAIHVNTNRFGTIKFYGITQDPETNSYMMVLEYAKEGNLREYLRINIINWRQKLFNLRDLSLNFRNIHELDIVHKDFHPGNILSSDFKNSMLQISDFGLSKLIGANPNNPEKKNIVGVLPYIAPEVLSGDEEYTKAADIYSFGIIAHEIVTGIPPYPDIPHDKDLAMKICNGLRPKIPFHTPKLITRTIMRCWDARVTCRPTFKELYDELYKYCIDYRDYLELRRNKDSEIVIQIKKAEEFSATQEIINTTTTTPLNYQTHPQAIYTSRLLNYSKLPKPKNEENFERELEELTKSMSYINSFLCYLVTGIPPYPDIPHDKDLAMKICNGLRPKIPFHTPKLITRTIMRCWDARVTCRPTFKELYDELYKYCIDYRDYLELRRNKDSEIVIQIKKAEEFSATQEIINTTTTTPLNYQTHPQAIYTSRLLNYSKLPKPKNEENFERELEELTKSMS
ncbi:hypothetical protein Glove_236g51 [Diversispora epigaea]|uniref:Protein kinase domain-containing protein n=1 Tax=Diversispora epigaea TaxID=1348612 RepID=A0A397IDA4_9GLOM|nr:hypothetical protein Glove_236g51 [Diversispora epigaea]